MPRLDKRQRPAGIFGPSRDDKPVEDERQPKPPPAITLDLPTMITRVTEPPPPRRQKPPSTPPTGNVRRMGMGRSEPRRRVSVEGAGMDAATKQNVSTHIEHSFGAQVHSHFSGWQQAADM